jgi:hypothetical protein
MYWARNWRLAGRYFSETAWEQNVFQIGRSSERDNHAVDPIGFAIAIAQCGEFWLVCRRLKSFTKKALEVPRGLVVRVIFKVQVNAFLLIILNWFAAFGLVEERREIADGGYMVCNLGRKIVGRTFE